MIVIPFINTVNFAYAKEFWLKSAKVPVISGLVVDNILDVSADIEAVVDAMGADTVVTVEYGLTLSYGSSITFPQSPVLATNSPVTVSVTLSSLLPYKRYFYRIIATNSKGSTIVANNFVTLEPVELTDGNWVAMYDALYNKNRYATTPYSNALTELRDTQFDCALGDELVPDPELNSSAGWSSGHATELIFADGKVKFVGATAQRSFYRAYTQWRNLHKIVANGVVVTQGNTRVRIGGGAMYTNGASIGYLQNGDNDLDVLPSDSTNFIYIINYSTYPTTVDIDYISIKPILGNHLAWATRSIYRARLIDDYIQFDGAANHVKAINIASIGTVYAHVQRNGIDEDFVHVNTLDNIGALDAANTTLYVGRNASGTYYNLKLKTLNIRSVTDDAGTIAKLNEWFSRESHELPELFNGILGTGIWNDAAIHDDTAIPVTI